MSPHDEDDGANLRVVPLNKEDDIKETKLDVVHSGKRYKLKIDACDHGFRVYYLTRVKKIDYTPGPLKGMVDPEEMAYLTVAEAHVFEMTPWDWIWHWSLERKVFSKVRNLKREFERGLARQDIATALQAKICK